MIINLLIKLPLRKDQYGRTSTRPVRKEYKTSTKRPVQSDGAYYFSSSKEDYNSYDELFNQRTLSYQDPSLWTSWEEYADNRFKVVIAENLPKFFI